MSGGVGYGNDKEAAPGNLPENTIDASEGYTVLDIPNFGTGEKAPYGNDVRAISIGPESEVDAIKIVSRSFNKGYHVVTTRQPFIGYIKGPFTIEPYYPAVDVAALEPTVFLAASKSLPTAQVIVWAKPPHWFGRSRVPIQYEGRDLFAAANVTKAFVVPTWGRKVVRVSIVTKVGVVPNAAITVQLLGLLFRQPGAPAPVNEIFYTGSTEDWPAIIVPAAQPNQEFTLNLEELGVQIPDGAFVGATRPRVQRPDMFGVLLSGPSGNPADIDAVITVFDE